MPELVRKYIDANREFDARKDVPDEDMEAWRGQVAKPLETKLMAAVPTSREGVVALLDAAIFLKYDNMSGPAEDLFWLDRLELRAIEHARDAIKAGAGCRGGGVS